MKFKIEIWEKSLYLEAYAENHRDAVKESGIELIPGDLIRVEGNRYMIQYLVTKDKKLREQWKLDFYKRK